MLNKYSIGVSLIIVYALIFSNTAIADTWIKKKCCWKDVAVNEHGTAFAVSNYGYMYRSEDGFTTIEKTHANTGWTGVAAGLNNSFWGLKNGVLYEFARDSSDTQYGGYSWQWRKSFPDINFVQLESGRDGLYGIDSSKNAYKTIYTNPRYFASNVSEIAIVLDDRGGSDWVYYLKGLIVKVVRHGITDTKEISGFKALTSSGGALYGVGASSKRVLKSTDAGNSWDYISGCCFRKTGANYKGGPIYAISGSKTMYLKQ